MTAIEKIAGLAQKKGPSAERIDIIHFDLAGNIADIPPGIPGTEVLIIFWRDDIPAGHAYVLRGRNGCISPIGLMGHVAPARDSLQASGPSVKKTLSAVICTRDRPGALWRCLQSLSQLNTPPDQILVVDNASRDDAAEDIARTFGADYTREDRPGLDYARNRGAREALGEIVAFVDDDVAVHPGWTERTIAAFGDPAVMAVTGLVLPAELETRAQIVFEAQWGFGRGYQRIDYRPDFLIASGQHIAPTWRIGAGANMAFRREIFDKVGYFDERLDAGAAGCGGDSEFWYRILARGWCCRYEPSSVVFHYHRRSERELANQIRAYMRGHVATLLVQNRRYHDRRNLRRVFATLPVWYGRKLLARLRNGKSEANAFVWQEVAGALGGVSYYLSLRASREAFPRGQLPFPEKDDGRAREPDAAGDEDLVSVIVPAFNAADTIAETLSSVSNQTYRNLEILVVDDGSRDATRDIVREMACADPRIRLIEKTNGGVASARNLGVMQSRGEFIAPVDADDLWRPTKIAKQMKAMREMGPACGLVYTWYAQIDHAGWIVSRKHKPLDEGLVLIRMCRGNVVGNGSGALMRKRAMLEAGLYDSTLRDRGAQGCEDLKLYFAIAERYLFAVVKEHLTGYRRIDWNMSSDVLQMERSNTIVTTEFQERYPQYGELFRVARATFLKWLFVRAVRLRRPAEAWVLARKIHALDQMVAIKILLMLPVTLARGWAVPRAKWLVKVLLRWNTDPVYFIRPAASSGPARRPEVKPRQVGAGILERFRGKSDLLRMGRIRTPWPKAARLDSGKDQLKLIWASTRDYRWAAPVLVLLGLCASVAETLGISLVILFLYAVIGGKADPNVSGGVLAHIFRFAQSLSGGNRPMLAALILLFIAGKAFFNLSYALLTARVKNAVSERARNAVYETYLSAPYGHLRSKDQGALLTILATESWAVADAFYAFTRLATNLCAIMVFSAFLISIAYPVFFAAIIGVGLLHGVSRQLTRPARALGAEILTAMRELTLHMINTLQAMRTIRAFSAQKYMDAIFRQASARVRQVLIRTDRIYSITGPLNEVGYFVLLGVIAWIAVRFDISTAATLGAVALLYRLQPHLREFEANLVKLANMAPTLASVESILRLRGEHRPAGARFSGLSQAIVFENVSFRYPGGAELALDHLHFSIPKGSRTVICGASGAGKTTIVNLLLGLYGPSAGRILVDGTPLADIEAADWLSGIALAGQDAELFEATVRDNIAIVRPGAGDEEIAWAARNAGIHDTILRLPAGYETWIGERGLNVSGGQRQRIALARAFLRRPSILILDEATNAVDMPLEAEIRRNVLDIMQQGTVIYITHRPDDVPGADHCIWLEEGCVRHQGEPSLLRALPRRMQSLSV